MKTSDGVSMGPKQCFASLRSYWSSIMCYDEEGHRDAMCWASHMGVHAPTLAS